MTKRKGRERKGRLPAQWRMASLPAKTDAVPCLHQLLFPLYVSVRSVSASFVFQHFCCLDLLLFIIPVYVGSSHSAQKTNCSNKILHFKSIKYTKAVEYGTHWTWDKLIWITWVCDKINFDVNWILKFWSHIFYWPKSAPNLGDYVTKHKLYT